MKLKTSQVLRPILVGLVTAFALSLLFWQLLGVFNLAGFWIWSTVIGLIGGGLGAWRRSIVIAVIATAVIRIAHFVVMTYVIGH